MCFIEDRQKLVDLRLQLLNRRAILDEAIRRNEALIRGDQEIQEQISREKAAAEIADNVLEHSRFRREFCLEYSERSSAINEFTEKVELLAELAEIVERMLPIAVAVVPQEYALSIAAMCAISFVKRGLDNYCNDYTSLNV